MKRALMLLGAVALVAVLVIGLTQAGGDGTAPRDDGTFDLAQARRQLAGAPAPLAALHDQANERSEEHTSELQSPCNLVCRLLLEKKKIRQHTNSTEET